MTTHQENFHRMALTGWLIGRFGIKTFVECGCLEGETIGYFSQFVPEGFGRGCDLNQNAVNIGQARYPGVRLDVENAVDWLCTVPVKLPALVYIDTVWVQNHLLHEQMGIIKGRWPGEPVMVNNVDLPGATGADMTPPAELQRYGRVIVPDYSTPVPMAGYGVIVPDGAELPPFKHWKVLPKQ